MTLTKFDFCMVFFEVFLNLTIPMFVRIKLPFIATKLNHIILVLRVKISWEMILLDESFVIAKSTPFLFSFSLIKMEMKIIITLKFSLVTSNHIKRVVLKEYE